jgi:hypothetical protein
MAMAVRSDPVPFAIGDEVRLKKPHPCGSVDWTVVRLGADIGLKCHGCERRVLLPRREVERRLKTFVTKAEDRLPSLDNSADSTLPELDESRR